MSRFGLVEYGAPVSIVNELAAAMGRGNADAARYLLDAGGRIARQVGLKKSPIEIAGSTASSSRVAGLLHLGRSCELEIVPKFLGSHAGGSGWREDFFFLAMLSKHGHILNSDRIRAQSGEENDLDLLLARAISDMYWERHHRPIRAYKRTREQDFFLEGEVDPLDLRFPDAAGYPQEVIRFSRANRFNAAIHAASRITQRHVRKPSAIVALSRVQRHLGSQPTVGHGHHMRLTVPGRARGWQALTDLSVDVVNGLGVGFNEGAGRAPGFMVATWQLWQDLLTLGLRLGFGSSSVRSEVPFSLGKRLRANGSEGRLNVRPDVTVSSNGFRFHVDAKYKGRIDRGKICAAEADVYEAMAFSAASGGLPVVLAYPQLASTPADPVGTIRIVERVQVPGSGPILAVTVEVRGISRRGSFSRFINEMRGALVDTLQGA
ncbi:restriction endonuclease [Pseudoxanthomonas mexicana]|uniref:Restriction endonuclease n=1 Tax=Pseudoxanthomonas mexicana TaxID=128785 RepID=A0ABX6RB67_PSEMX|nr:restriction endonuclease [Pseudoxanthomonas mexicana]QND80512.1 restriction endonuclease [Pseudoxanthomonas mexicana]